MFRGVWAGANDIFTKKGIWFWFYAVPALS